MGNVAFHSHHDGAFTVQRSREPAGDPAANFGLFPWIRLPVLCVWKGHNTPGSGARCGALVFVATSQIVLEIFKNWETAQRHTMYTVINRYLPVTVPDYCHILTYLRHAT